MDPSRRKLLAAFGAGSLASLRAPAPAAPAPASAAAPVALRFIPDVSSAEAGWS